MDGDLYELKSKLNSSWNNLLPLAVKMCRCVCNIHEENICHLDIKCSNFLFKLCGCTTVIKLCDFGCSEIIGKRKNVVYERKGTILYMPPELNTDISFQEILPKKIDVFTFGMMMRVLFCEGSPYSVGNNEAVKYAKGKKKYGHSFLSILSNNPEIQPLEPFTENENGECLPPKVREIIADCLNHEAKSRPTMRDVLNVLQTVLYEDEEVRMFWKRYRRLDSLKYCNTDLSVTDVNGKPFLKIWKSFLHHSTVYDDLANVSNISVSFPSNSIIPTKSVVALLSQSVCPDCFETLNEEQIIDLYFFLKEMGLVSSMKRFGHHTVLVNSTLQSCIILLQCLIQRGLEVDIDCGVPQFDPRIICKSSMTVLLLKRINDLVYKKSIVVCDKEFLEPNIIKIISFFKSNNLSIDVRGNYHGDHLENEKLRETSDQRSRLNFSEILNDERTSNIELVCSNGNIFHCHLELLLLSSSFFRKLFSFGECKEVEEYEKSGNITMEMDSEDLAVLLEFLYDNFFFCTSESGDFINCRKLKVLLDLYYHCCVFKDDYLMASVMFTLDYLIFHKQKRDYSDMKWKFIKKYVWPNYNSRENNEFNEILTKLGISETCLISIQNKIVMLMNEVGNEGMTEKSILDTLMSSHSFEFVDLEMVLFILEETECILKNRKGEFKLMNPEYNPRLLIGVHRKERKSLKREKKSNIYRTFVENLEAEERNDDVEYQIDSDLMELCSVENCSYKSCKDIREKRIKDDNIVIKEEMIIVQCFSCNGFLVVCPICGKKITKKKKRMGKIEKGLISHVRKKHKKFDCKFCELCFDKIEVYISHVTSHYMKSSRNEENKSGRKEESIDSRTIDDGGYGGESIGELYHESENPMVMYARKIEETRDLQFKIFRESLECDNENPIPPRFLRYIDPLNKREVRDAKETYISPEEVVELNRNGLILGSLPNDFTKFDSEYVRGFFEHQLRRDRNRTDIQFELDIHHNDPTRTKAGILPRTTSEFYKWASVFTPEPSKFPYNGQSHLDLYNELSDLPNLNKLPYRVRNHRHSCFWDPKIYVNRLINFQSLSSKCHWELEDYPVVKEYRHCQLYRETYNSISTGGNPSLPIILGGFGDGTSLNYYSHGSPIMGWYMCCLNMDYVDYCDVYNSFLVSCHDEHCLICSKYSHHLIASSLVLNSRGFLVPTPRSEEGEYCSVGAVLGDFFMDMKERNFCTSRVLAFSSALHSYTTTNATRKDFLNTEYQFDSFRFRDQYLKERAEAKDIYINGFIDLPNLLPKQSRPGFSKIEKIPTRNGFVFTHAPNKKGKKGHERLFMPEEPYLSLKDQKHRPFRVQSELAPDYSHAGLVNMSKVYILKVDEHLSKSTEGAEGKRARINYRIGKMNEMLPRELVKLPPWEELVRKKDMNQIISFCHSCPYVLNFEFIDEVLLKATMLHCAAVSLIWRDINPDDDRSNFLTLLKESFELAKQFELRNEGDNKEEDFKFEDGYGSIFCDEESEKMSDEEDVEPIIGKKKKVKKKISFLTHPSSLAEIECGRDVTRPAVKKYSTKAFEVFHKLLKICRTEVGRRDYEKIGQRFHQLVSFNQCVGSVRKDRISESGKHLSHKLGDLEFTFELHKPRNTGEVLPGFEIENFILENTCFPVLKIRRRSGCELDNSSFFSFHNTSVFDPFNSYGRVSGIFLCDIKKAENDPTCYQILVVSFRRVSTTRVTLFKNDEDSYFHLRKVNKTFNEEYYMNADLFRCELLFFPRIREESNESGLEFYSERVFNPHYNPN